ncbi:MAG: hypothetical protein ACFB0C_24035 [Leptolyngbyaceae cyanobacterium]
MSLKRWLAISGCIGHLLRSDVDPETEANVLLALGNGVCLDTLIQGSRQQAVFQRHVDT